MIDHRERLNRIGVNQHLIVSVNLLISLTKHVCTMFILEINSCLILDGKTKR